jgi:hypothetical protein
MISTLTQLVPSKICLSSLSILQGCVDEVLFLCFASIGGELRRQFPSFDTLIPLLLVSQLLQYFRMNTTYLSS